MECNGMLRSSGARNEMECCVAAERGMKWNAAERGMKWNPNPIKNTVYFIGFVIV